MYRICSIRFHHSIITAGSRTESTTRLLYSCLFHTVYIASSSASSFILSLRGCRIIRIVPHTLIDTMIYRSTRERNRALITPELPGGKEKGSFGIVV